MAVVRDITRRKQVEEALQEQEERFRAIFNSVNEAIFVHDLGNGKILDVNDRMCEMYGYTYKEALRLEVEDLVRVNRRITRSTPLNGWKRP